MRKIYFIDLFCGAGGVTSGIHRARYKEQQFAKVIACVNHDPLAIESHEANHPDCIHYVEKIQVLDLAELKVIVKKLRRQDPDCLIFIWASIECTNFSKAKGGLPRDADSRTLAEHLFRYEEELYLDGWFIENVEEFMAWGPLDGNGKPISKRNGEDYIRWVNKMQSYGYNFDYRILNAADFGAYTSRRRYFAQFMRPGLSITWPEATHSKKPSHTGMFGQLDKWRAVKEVLDLTDEGKSIFDRKKPLSEKTLERIYAGLLKYVANGDDMFIAKHFSGRPKGKVIPVDGPAGTVTTFNGQSLVNVSFIAKYYSNGGQLNTIEEPASTLPTKDRLSLVTPTFLLNPAWGGYSTSIDQPSPVIIARGDKAPIYLVQADGGVFAGQISFMKFPSPPHSYNVLSNTKITIFMIKHGIVDIKMRMLKIPELLRIQGFGDDYHLKGSQADQKKFIGNAVEVNQAKVIIEASYAGIMGLTERKTA
ncbi:DNA cytosine methyltransferase [Chitinophaga sp. LS1]|uniref:DNA cytosine methyltransferase n=1 Tax=Chitinophaga sp. LS1 TaxID=3051176 RepID=UPI002AABD9AE|nr:DNA cytosine methyltransferase [Chitinophaga sp. LS1]WPV66307.1 DNA cytosine methyltransferase [Chitinophaga sp. LS1]